MSLWRCAVKLGDSYHQQRASLINVGGSTRKERVPTVNVNDKTQ